MQKFSLNALAEPKKALGAIVAQIVAASKESPEATIYLYDPIYGSRMMAEWCGGICAQDLVPLIDSIDAETIRLRINCPGGDVFGMAAIQNSLRNHKAKKIAQVDGIAASAATGIALACDEVYMEKGALFMIHNCHGMGFGNKNDLRKQADTMDKVDGELVATYVEKSGQKEAQIREWMDAETFFTVAEAIAAGFATEKPKADPEKADDGKKALLNDLAAKWVVAAPIPDAQPEPSPEPVAQAVAPAPAPAAPTTISADDRDALTRRLRMSRVNDSRALAQ